MTVDNFVDNGTLTATKASKHAASYKMLKRKAKNKSHKINELIDCSSRKEFFDEKTILQCTSRNFVNNRQIFLQKKLTLYPDQASEA